MRLPIAILFVTVLSAERTALAQQTELGVLNGASYRITVPTTWNGTVVIFLPGYSDKPAKFDTAASVGALAEHLVQEGTLYAEAGYHAGGWAVAEALDDVERLRDHLAARFGAPKRVVLMGEWEIGFAANRRLLHVESLSHDCLIGEDRLHTVTAPVLVDDQRAAGLRFGDRRVHALMQALCLFALAPTGFRHRELRDRVAQLQSRTPDTYSAGSMTYDLRRLRLHGLIERIPHSHRYRITPGGAPVAMFYARLYTRALRPACSLKPEGAPRTQRAFDRLDAALAHFLEEIKLAA